MRTILAVHLRSPAHNIGDLSCCPLDYVSLPGYNVQHIDLREYEGGDAIIGGGGLLHPGLDQRLRSSLAVRAKRVLWGIGTNYHDTAAPVHPSWLAEFDLASVRDFTDHPLPPGLRCVPCPSCLSPRFDFPRPEPVLDAVIYDHLERRVETVRDNLPRLDNSGITVADFERALAFISSARVVITSSYHGAYWALLLGRTPIVSEPFSNRFCFFEIPLPVITRTSRDWRAKAEKFSPPTDYLSRCRKLNLDFFEDVKRLFAPLDARDSSVALESSGVVSQATPIQPHEPRTIDPN